MTAISEYLRTALVIDDRVQDGYGPLEELSIDETEGVSSEPQSDLVPPPADDETPVHPLALVRAFIDAGIVCGVLRPDEDDSDLVDLARRGARIADLLILDWLLFGEDTTTIEMISAVAEANKGRLTVAVIFTGALSLSNIVERLTEETDFELVDDFVWTPEPSCTERCCHKPMTPDPSSSGCLPATSSRLCTTQGPAMAGASILRPSHWREQRAVGIQASFPEG